MNTEDWLHSLHVVGVVLWVAGLTGVLAMLQIHPDLEEKSRAVLGRAERQLAVVMDIGATLAIGMGLWMALRHVPNEFKHGKWLHVKLTAVAACVISVQVFARIKVKRFRNGDLRPVPFGIWIVFAVGVVTAVMLGASPGLLRG